ncbi:MAG: hypothetical protein Q7T55_22465 [Solirubrobacteraceae bacterium]|nr:hypothetical protein [Solirubrobacteraceae bacterium]
MIRAPHTVRAGGRLVPVVALAGCGLLLAGCTTTQERSAKMSSQAAKAAEAKKFNVGKTSRDVVAEDVVRLEGDGSAAVVVRLDNRTGQAQTMLPIGVDLYDAKKQSLYTNRIDGLDLALNTVSVAPPGVSYWVNNQVPVAKPERTRVRVGVPKGKLPADLPEMKISETKLGDDAGVHTLQGKVRNLSKVEQKRLTIFAVASDGGKVVAAGRGVVDLLPPGGKAKRFSIYFTGDPRGAKLHVDAPPSTLAGA